MPEWTQRRIARTRFQYNEIGLLQLVFFLKAIHATGGVDNTLLAGIKRVAVGADFHLHIPAGGASFIRRAAYALDGGLFIFRMDTSFHKNLPIPAASFSGQSVLAGNQSSGRQPRDKTRESGFQPGRIRGHRLMESAYPYYSRTLYHPILSARITTAEPITVCGHRAAMYLLETHQ